MIKITKLVVKALFLFFLIFLSFLLFSRKMAMAAVEIVSVPQEVQIGEEFAVLVSLSGISGPQRIGIAIHKESGQPYFGLTQVGESWIEMEDENCQDLVYVEPQGDWVGEIAGKVVYGEKDFDDSLGDYLLRVVKYTQAACDNGGRSKTYSDEVQVVLSDDNPPAPTPSPTQTPIPLPTPTPTALATPQPPKAYYKINQPKDEEGQLVTSAKIYVDGQYIHHYAPEELEFCPDCYCDPDNSVDCALGEHTIRLEKSGHEPWQETKTFSAGQSGEVSPILKKISPSATPLPTLPLAPTAVSSPTSRPSLSPSPAISPTLSVDNKPESSGSAEPEGEVLGEARAIDLLISKPEVEGQDDKEWAILPIVAIVLGTGFIGASGLLFIRHREPLP